MKTTNKLELTENQKDMLINALLRELHTIDGDVSKYAFDETILEPLKKHRDEMYEIYKKVVNSKEDE